MKEVEKKDQPDVSGGCVIDPDGVILPDPPFPPEPGPCIGPDIIQWPIPVRNIE